MRSSEMAIPINRALSRQPISMENKRPDLPLNLLFNRQIQETSRALPAMIQGMMAGIADITGLPEMKKAVTGVIRDRMIPHIRPPQSPARMIQALITGPVI